MQAIILAGGQINGEYKALRRLGSQTMLDYVLTALRRTGRFNRLIVVGNRQQMASWQSDDVIVIDGAVNLLNSFLNGVKLLNRWEKFLVITADIPLVTAEAIDDFLTKCSGEAEVCYPIISQSDIEAKFGKVERTYVKLKNGSFTGGNLLLLHPAALEKCLPLAAKMTELRKSPLKLAGLLGWRIIWQMFTRQLTIDSVCARIFAITGVRAHGIISKYAVIGMDFDKPADEAAMRQFID